MVNAPKASDPWPVLQGYSRRTSLEFCVPIRLWCLEKAEAMLGQLHPAVCPELALTCLALR